MPSAMALGYSFEGFFHLIFLSLKPHKLDSRPPIIIFAIVYYCTAIPPDPRIVNFLRGPLNMNSQHRYSPTDRDIVALPERDLWASVLLQAIDDLAGTTGFQSIQAKAECWFQSRSEEPRAFRWVCHHLDLNPAAVLKRIRLKQSARKHDLVSQTSINIIPDRFLPSDIEQRTSDTLS